jgi:beta-ketodecanoyl-[acyl-carrier-protein] synthase
LTALSSTGSATSGVFITGTGLFTPAESISNAELVASFNEYVSRFNARNADAIAAGTLDALTPSSVEFVEKASGIKSRYVINKSGVLDPDRLCPSISERAEDEPSLQCDMAVAAANEALANAGISGSDIDAVIVACSNMQRPYPAMAVEVQAAIGAKGFAYDMNVACSSATFGIQAAYNAIVAGNADRVLMVNPEICSGHLAWQDRDCHFIFGDACTAVIVERGSVATSPVRWEILGTRLQTVYSNNIRNNFGFLNRADESGVGARDKLFHQNGRKVFMDVCPMVAEQITAHLAALDVPVDSLKRMWLHQANLKMNELIARRVLGRDALIEEAPVILDRYANTSSAGSIIAFHLHQENLAAGDTGVICSFGAGYSIGSIVVRRLS